MRKPDTPDELLPLTPAVFHILVALSEGERHGYAIMRQVAEDTDGSLQLGPGTLYGCLNYINKPDKKLITVEDPVEYQMAGINQVQVNSDIGMTFPAALRSMLRQAPNIIMIGEIRDLETANIAINASLTGHLVFSTLHTNDAPGAITRLIDMGVEPFLVASAIELVIAQRLVRRLCPACSRSEPTNKIKLRESLAILGCNEAEADLIISLKGPVGCDRCRGAIRPASRRRARRQGRRAAEPGCSAAAAFVHPASARRRPGGDRAWLAM